MDSEGDSDMEAPILEKQEIINANDKEVKKKVPSVTTTKSESPPTLYHAVQSTKEHQEHPQQLRKSKRNKWSNLLKPQKIPRATRVSSSCGDVPKDCQPRDESTGRNRLFRCNKCPLTSPNAADFMRHYQNHGSQKMFTCRSCDYSADFLNRVRKHEKIHNQLQTLEGVKKEESFIHLASSGISLSEEWREKARRLNAEPGTLICTHCDFLTLGTSEMFFHRCKVHPRAPPVGHYFQVPEMKTAEGKRKSISEIAEEKRWSISETVNAVVQGSKPLTLKIKRTFSAESYPAATKPDTVAGHGKLGQVEQGKTEKCPNCPFRTDIPDLMRNHLAGHRRSTGYKCPHCSFRVLMYTMLARHAVLHEEGGKMGRKSRSSPQKRGRVIKKCPHCPHTSAYNIGRHIKQHSAEGAFRCPECTFRTDILGALNYHKGFHGEAVKLTEDLNPDASLKPVEPEKKPVAHLERRTKSCPKCPYIGKRNTDILKHLKHHGKKTLFTCPFCDFGSNAIRAVKVHQTIHKETKSPNSAGSQWFRCKMCPFRTRRQTAAKYHARCHLKKRRFQCTKCCFSAGCRFELTLHLRLHSEPNKHTSNKRHRLTFPCAICGISVASYARFSVHRIVHHSRKFTLGPSLKAFLRGQTTRKMCPILPPVVPTAVESKAVVRVAGSQYSSLKKRHCPHCPYRTPHNTDLRKHLSHHDTSFPFRCSFCTFSCNSALSLTHHKNMHKRAELAASAPEKKVGDAAVGTGSLVPDVKQDTEGTDSSPVTQYYCCGMCPYTTKHAYDLVAHRKMHQGLRRHRCTQCSYSSLRTNALRKHMKLHSDKAQILRAKSALPASRKAISSHDLKEKIIRDVSGREVGVLRMENGYRVYTCNFCPFRTSMNSNLMSHYRLHAGSRSHKCPHCTFNTSVLRRLEDHLIVHEANYSSSAPLDSPGQMNSGWVPKIRGPYSRSGTEYTCKHCPHTAQSYTSLWYHLQKHKKPGKFKCEHCSFSSGSVSCLRRHESIHECGGFPLQDSKEHSCSKSPKRSRDEANTGDRHRQESEEDTDGTETEEDRLLEIALANLEDGDFVNKIVDKEKRDNANPNFRGYMCFKCGHLEKKFGLYRIHKMLHKNPGSRPFQCPYCSLSANHPDTLRFHLNNQHPDEKELDESAGTRDRRLRCPNCSFVARTSERLMEHQSTHLPEFWKRQREKEKFKRKSRQLGTGIWSKGRWVSTSGHTGSSLSVREYMNFYCPKCSFQCEHQKNYKKHVDMHGRKDSTFMCSVCDYSCKQLNVVRFHELNHHTSMPFTALFGPELGTEEPKIQDALVAEEPKQQSGTVTRCTLCDFSTEDLQTLTDHWNSHMGESNGDAEKFSFLSSFSLFPK